MAGLLMEDLARGERHNGESDETALGRMAAGGGM